MKRTKGVPLASYFTDENGRRTNVSPFTHYPDLCPIFKGDSEGDCAGRCGDLSIIQRPCILGATESKEAAEAVPPTSTLPSPAPVPARTPATPHEPEQTNADPLKDYRDGKGRFVKGVPNAMKRGQNAPGAPAVPSAQEQVPARERVPEPVRAPAPEPEPPSGKPKLTPLEKLTAKGLGAMIEDARDIKERHNKEWDRHIQTLEILKRRIEERG